MKNVAIVGGTGYGALELIRFIEGHDYLKLTQIISQSQEGHLLEEMYPHLATYIDAPLEAFDFIKIRDKIDIVFFATPAGVTKEMLPQFLDSPIQCIDLSGDLRLSNPSDYEKWYGGKPASQNLLDNAVYGLSEIYPNEIQGAHICSNPGCYSTASLLGMIPAVQNDLIDTSSIIIDGKTGVSGAGRKTSIMTHFSETNENVKPYKIGKHQHIPEIEQYLSKEANQSVVINMTTHLIPMTRGLLCTMYGRLNQSINVQEVHEIYQKFYQSHPFVRVRNLESYPATKEVYGSNYCDIGVYIDERTRQLVVISAIDNLVKGAAGQAIQNANLMNGWPVDLGLRQIPVFP
ncbi:N-acetyl-gamma-glutamyl-phosphate reductase [Salipaludibacillus keqinensis]|uniref:N-acetyl-gamma-glutamyl-phosphate reductase n=1 Tax=Salipaludibacillus keqinensis TaxID=2045207 RepID=A0A323TJI4_9BACI|nr:N-acetyl-gamma-glutamyl-phosphate reductase [Salipaludibacillus keqinensis]PYZ95131.1 N-acetyl-gamma-glutamyl-phosphate reductase [Salipaludibacillus keqinensis]